MQIQPLETISRLGLYDCDLSPDGLTVAAVYLDDGGHRLGLWTTSSCSPLLALELRGAYLRPRFSPDSQRLAGARGGDELTVWSLPGGEVIFAADRSGGEAIVAHAFGFQGQTMVIAQGDRLGFWSVESGEWLASVPMPAEIDVLKTSPDGRLLAAGLHAGGVVVVDAQGREVVVTLPEIRLPVTALAFHPSQPWLMAATSPVFRPAGERWERADHGWAEVWNYRNPERIARITCDYQAALVGGGHYVATLTDNSRNLWIWEVPGADLVGHIENVVPERMVDDRGRELRQATLAATPLGDLLAVAGLSRPIAADGVLRLFAIHTEAVAQAT